MGILAPVLLILGGLLAASNVIVAKRPDAQQMINKLVPFQGAIGVALLVVGVLNLLRSFSAFQELSRYPVFGASLITVVGGSILLGFLFGMPLIAKLIPGESPAEQKAAQLASSIAGFQVIIGLAGIVGSLLLILFRLGLRMM